MIKVVAGYIIKNNKILIARRKTGDEEVFGKWEFPGGKVEIGEDEYYAIEREIQEEFDLDIKAHYFITNTIHKTKNKEIDLRLYYCTYEEGKIKLHDHFEYKWISKKDILNYDLTPADTILAKYIKEME